MYFLAYLPSCKDEIKKYAKKNKELKNALKAKVNKILSNPYQFKPLRGPLAGLRRVHVLKSFVLIYRIDEKNKTVVLVRFAYHDEAYR